MRPSSAPLLSNFPWGQEDGGIFDAGLDTPFPPHSVERLILELRITVVRPYY